jgi:hypothetical protein
MRRLMTIAAAVVFTVLFVTVPSQAQFGSLKRKAKAAATQAVTGQPPAASSGTVQFNETVLELNAALVNRMIAGLQARARFKGPTGETAGQVRHRATRGDSIRAALQTEHNEDINNYTNALGTAQNCKSEYLSGLQRKQMEDMQRRLMGGATASSQKGQDIAAMAQAAADMSQAMASGDSAAIRRANAAFYRALGIDPKADTAAAEKACRVPPRPAWYTRIDSLSDASAKAWELARDLERQASDTAIRIVGGGITAEQFAMAAERIEMWVAVAEAGPAAHGLAKWSAVEEKALRDRLDELKALFS